MESETIANIYRTKVNENITGIHGIQQIFEQNSVFHFCGHARPTQNGSLILAGADGKATKMVSGRELSLINSNLNLAVLSACETGIGDQKKGEAMLSLTRSLAQGGTPNIINSLWAVNDQTSANIMTSFHQKLSEGNAINSSLREAKLNYLKTHSGDELHPYYWGGFIYTTLENSSESSNNYLFLWAIGVLVTAFIIYKFKT